MNDDAWTLLRGLFPKWDPTMEEAALFRKAFSSRRPELLKAAVENYRTYYKYREPNLGEILKRYADLVREADQSKARQAGDEVSDQDDAAEAEALAASRRRIDHDLELLSDDEVALVLTECGNMSSLAGFVHRLSGSPGSWTHVQRGLVWAKADQMGLLAGSSSSTAHRSLSLGQD